MVKYYGRARQRIGSVNTNQIGLKMSGCPSKVGRQGYLSRYIARRAQCNQKYCGPVYYHGVIWSWNSGRCVAKAPRGQSFNSGVGHKNTPRFACGNTCATSLDFLTALKILKAYVKDKYGDAGNLILVGEKESLTSDNVPNAEDFAQIKHFVRSGSEWKLLTPREKYAADMINCLKYTASIRPYGEPKTKKKYVRHVVGYETTQGQFALHNAGYGRIHKYGPDSKHTITSFETMTPCEKKCDTNAMAKKPEGVSNKEWRDSKPGYGRYWYPCAKKCEKGSTSGYERLDPKTGNCTTQ